MKQDNSSTGLHTEKVQYAHAYLTLGDPLVLMKLDVENNSGLPRINEFMAELVRVFMISANRSDHSIFAFNAAARCLSCSPKSSGRNERFSRVLLKG